MDEVKKEDSTQQEIKKDIPPQTAPQAEKKVEETQDQINWRKFRESREKERIEKEKELEEERKKASSAQEQAKAFKEALDAVMNKEQTPSPAQQSQESDMDFNSLDMPTGKEIASFTQKSINEGIQKGLEKYIAEQKRVSQEKDQQQLPKKLRDSHDNFDKICSQENLDYLEYHYPEVAVPYSQMPDSYSKWSNIYKAIKKFVPNTDVKADKQKMEKNLNSPQSISAVGSQAEAATSKGVHQTKKEQNWARMQKIMKGL